MKKQRYTITALVPISASTPIESATDIETHRRTHAAGIPEFKMQESALKFVVLEFTAPPDPLAPIYPEKHAQDAATAFIAAEIKARYPGHGKLKFKLEPIATP